MWLQATDVDVHGEAWPLRFFFFTGLQLEGRISGSGSAIQRAPLLFGPLQKGFRINNNLLNGQAPPPEIGQRLFCLFLPLLEGIFDMLRIGGNLLQPFPLIPFVPAKSVAYSFIRHGCS